MLGLLVRVFVRLATKPSRRKEHAPEEPKPVYGGNRPPNAALHPYLEAGGRVSRDGVDLQVDVIAPSLYEPWFFGHVRTPARGPRMLRSYDWNASVVPPSAYALLQLPSVDQHTRADAISASALPALEPTWSVLRAEAVRVVIASDGAEVIAWLDEPRSPHVVEQTIAAVTAMARWDAALAATLAALPDATPLADAALSPAVTLDPDGLRVGVRGGALVAELNGVTRPIDPSRMLADIAAFRAHFAHVGPYR